ncbi:MAG: SUMF1/EgtB/PvdO family nonheme iron enzyme [Pirellulaceae bacterium]|nr:SUMF1/EgtB/PvdO family nonheme iron enzyme [Pirellulaceae bacterium]
MRASLATARHDPTQVAFLLKRIPALRPAEVDVIRKTLAELAADDPRITQRLWDSLANLNADASGVLPTAAALAEIAPPQDSTSAADSPADGAWQQHGDLVAEALVRSNIVYLGQWLDQLEGVRKLLLPGLAKIYGDRSEQRGETQRDLATSILERYATDDAKLLAGLLIDGEPAQYQKMFPLAAAPENSGEVIAVMKQELGEQLQPTWNDPPVDPAWSVPDAGALAAIEASGGLVNVEERFAFCQSMPREQFMQVAERLRSSGFRPTRVRPHSVDDQLHVSAVWTRDGRAWQVDWDLERDQLPQDVALVNPMRERGNPPESLARLRFGLHPNSERLFPISLETEVQPSPQSPDSLGETPPSPQPPFSPLAPLRGEGPGERGLAAESEMELTATDIAGYLDTSGDQPTERYVVLWSEPAAGSGDRRLIAGANAQLLDAAKQSFAQAGLKSLDTLHVFVAADGSRKYSAVFSGSGADSTVMPAYAGWERVDQPQWDVSLAADGTLPDPLAIYRQQLTQVEQALKAQPDVPQLKLVRAVCSFRLGNNEAALADLDDLDAKGVTTADVQQYRAFVLARLGKSEAAREALETFQSATANESLRMVVGVVVAAWLGETEEANQQLDTMAANTPADAGLLYDAACASSLASLPGASLDAESVKAFAERALQLLGAAVEAGFSDGRHMRSDPDFAPLHQDARFADLVQRISPSSRYAGLWRPDTQVESRLLSELSAEDHLEQSRTLVAEGFRPVSVALLPGDSGGSNVAASVWHRPLIPDVDKEQLAIRQSHAAVTLLRLGQANLVWPLLRHQPDPRPRSYILSRLASLGADGNALWARLKDEPDVSARRTLILALGDQAKLDLLDDAVREQLVARLLEVYREDPDAGLHGAAEWTLKQLGQQEELRKTRQGLATGAVVGNRQWYVTKTGDHAMVVLAPREPFLMGSPVAETERAVSPTIPTELRHRRRIARRFAIGMHEVAVAQFRAFRNNHKFDRQYAREDDAPANVVSWYDAAGFCNWLSEQEGLGREEWCYDPDQPFQDGMQLYPDYLSRRGYRLPTEAEWEYACRAQAVTARHYGETSTLLGDYAWYRENSLGRWLLPVGSLRPNDFGLFDMQGNILEWCQDLPLLYPTDRVEVLDEEQAKLYASTRLQGVRDTDRRVLRGGCSTDDARFVRGAFRLVYYPVSRFVHLGFRVARTLPP